MRESIQVSGTENPFTRDVNGFEIEGSRPEGADGVEVVEGEILFCECGEVADVERCGVACGVARGDLGEGRDVENEHVRDALAWARVCAVAVEDHEGGETRDVEVQADLFAKFACGRVGEGGVRRFNVTARHGEASLERVLRAADQDDLAAIDDNGDVDSDDGLFGVHGLLLFVSRQTEIDEAARNRRKAFPSRRFQPNTQGSRT